MSFFNMPASSNGIGIGQHTPHHRRKGLMPKMTEMMDKLVITSTESDVAHQEQSEAKGNVALGSHKLVSTPETPGSDSLFYACEFCGHRPPHEQLMILHSHSHLDNHRMEVRRDMYAKLDSISKMVADMRSIHLDDEQTSQETVLHNQKQVGRKMRTRHVFGNHNRPRP